MLATRTVLADRSGNLYNPAILEGNWLEDREQQTVGTNDGLRGNTDFQECFANAKTRKFDPDISVPECHGDPTAVSIATATRYKRQPRPATDRVMPNLGVTNDERFRTTSREMSNLPPDPFRNDYRPMVTAETFHTASIPRTTSKPARGYGAVVKQHPDNHEQRHWETTTGSAYVAHNRGQDPKAGFKYDSSVQANPLPFPCGENAIKTQNAKDAKQGSFSEHHICTATRMFLDYRGQQPPRLGIVAPEDAHGPPLPLAIAETYPKQEGPKDFTRKNIIAGDARDNDRRAGFRLWQDDA